MTNEPNMCNFIINLFTFLKLGDKVDTLFKNREVYNKIIVNKFLHCISYDKFYFFHNINIEN